MIVDALIVNVTPGQTPGVARNFTNVFFCIYIYNIYVYILYLHENTTDISITSSYKTHHNNDYAT